MAKKSTDPENFQESDPNNPKIWFHQFGKKKKLFWGNF